jgi:hypothetical protein
MERAGLTPTGYASPNGTWHRALAHAVEDHGFDYSTEFSLDYDDLPFLPWLGDRFSSVMQVPVHPVSIGSLIRAKATTGDMKNYFRMMTDRFLLRNEPVIFYHHPGHEHYDVMEDTFEHARGLGLPAMTLGDYARWWRRRTGTRFDVTVDGEGLCVTSRNRFDDVLFSADHPDGRRGFIRTDGATMFADIQWSNISSESMPPPAGIRSARSFSLRALLHSIEDFNYRIRQ